MGWSGTLQTVDYTGEDQTWLGSKHGTDAANSITLDGDLFLATFPTGIVPSGVVLGKITATGKYGPYSNAAVDGRETARGHLFSTTDLEGITAASAQDKVAAMLSHGEVIEAKLPTGHGLDAPGKVELAAMRYV